MCYGNFFDACADYWDNHRDDPNILLIWYEDLKEVTLTFNSLLLIVSPKYFPLSYVKFSSTPQIRDYSVDLLIPSFQNEILVGTVSNCSTSLL